MLKKLAALFSFKTEPYHPPAYSLPDPAEVPRAPAPRPVAPMRRDAVSAAPTAQMFGIGEELARWRRESPMDLVMAVNSKVDSWKLLASMGSPYGIPDAKNIRGIMIKAEGEEFSTQQLYYAVVQNEVYRACTNASEVRGL